MNCTKCNQEYSSYDLRYGACVGCIAKERDESKVELARVQAACAEMRKTLEHWQSYNQASIPTTADEQEEAGEDFTSVWTETDHALSTDAGKGWASPEDVKVLVGALEYTVAWSKQGWGTPTEITGDKMMDAVRNALALSKSKGLA